MGISAIVSNLLRALASYWELKSKRYEHDLREQSRARIEALEDELTKLRNTGTIGNTIVADRLRDRIITERAYFKHLPNSNIES